MTAVQTLAFNTRKHGFINVLSLLVLALGLVAAIYSETIVSMVKIWSRSDTYAHCFFILPAAIYLMWTNANEIDQAPRPNVLLALLILPLTFVWLLAAMVDVAVILQFSVVAMLITATLSLLGWPLSRKIIFPLGILFLSVPVGEELIPVMIEFTANFTVETLRILGLPVFREGNEFLLPTGHWSVVEACSGVRYLIASFTIGLLYAYLTYRSFWRRFLFILLSLIVPIFANGMRAVMIVLLGHYSGMTIATGVDHLVYGWLFFGLVIFIMFWIGNFWREDSNRTGITLTEPNLPGGSKKQEQVECLLAPDHAVASLKRFILPLLVITAALLAGPIWLSWSTHTISVQLQKELSQFYSLKVNDLQGWHGYQLCESCQSLYQPNYKKADSYQSVTLEAADHDIHITVHRAAYYSWSEQGELINSMNLVVSREDSNNSIRIHRSSVNPGNLPSLMRILISGKKNYLVYCWRSVSGQLFESDIEGKIIEAYYKLTGTRFQSQFVAVSVPYHISPEEVENTLSEFVLSNASLLGLADARN